MSWLRKFDLESAVHKHIHTKPRPGRRYANIYERPYLGAVIPALFRTEDFRQLAKQLERHVNNRTMTPLDAIGMTIGVASKINELESTFHTHAFSKFPGAREKARLLHPLVVACHAAVTGYRVPIDLTQLIPVEHLNEEGRIIFNRRKIAGDRRITLELARVGKERRLRLIIRTSSAGK